MPDQINLRIPGPTPLPDTVRDASARQMINHRGPEFRELLERVTARLQRAFVTANDILIVSASGTGGLEALVVNHLSPGDAVLAVSIGAFGDRFATIARTYGADVTKLDVEWGRAADPDQVAEALRSMANAGRPARAILFTHNETSTGIENPLGALAAAAHDASPETLILVDAISGLGAVPFETDAWGLDAVATGSQKSWMSPPGLAMVSMSERAWAANARAAMPRFYFDLGRARKSAEKGQTPWTPAVGVVFALDRALELLEQEGYEAVFARHAACARAARAGLAALGYRLFADPEHASRTVTSAYLADGVDWPTLNGRLLAAGLVVAGGQERLSGKIMRIGHLGRVGVDDVVAAIEIIGRESHGLGLDVNAEAGVAAARSAAAESMAGAASA